MGCPCEGAHMAGRTAVPGAPHCGLLRVEPDAR
jgi:hypothetical protein